MENWGGGGVRYGKYLTGWGRVIGFVEITKWMVNSKFEIQWSGSEFIFFRVVGVHGPQYGQKEGC